MGVPILVPALLLLWHALVPGTGQARSVAAGKEDAIVFTRLRLVAARTSIRRGQNLEINVVPAEGKAPGATSDTVVLSFPAHSFTPHESTLMTLIGSCVAWSTPESPYEWHRATCDLVLAVPKRAEGYSLDYEDWRLSSFRCQADAPHLRAHKSMMDPRWMGPSMARFLASKWRARGPVLGGP
jgi:hypothetical protein